MLRIFAPVVICGLGIMPLSTGSAYGFANGVAAFVSETTNQMVDSRQTNNPDGQDRNDSIITESGGDDFVIVPDSVFSATFVIYQDMLGETETPAPASVVVVPRTAPNPGVVSQNSRGKIIKPGLGWSTGMYR